MNSVIGGDLLVDRLVEPAVDLHRRRDPGGADGHGVAVAGEDGLRGHGHSGETHERQDRSGDDTHQGDAYHHSSW